MRSTLASGTAIEVARPSGDPTMGLVIAPDIFGLRPLYDDMCARLAAEWGMVVIAVEPFPGQDLGPEVEGRFAAVAGNLDTELLHDLCLAADETGCERVGLLGFCMGGMYALKAAGLGRFDRVASFYGMIKVPEAWVGPGHGEPLDVLAAPAASPVLAIIGDRDHYTPPGDVEALAACPNVTVVRYPEAEHGFAHDAARPSHRPDDAADAWALAQVFLAAAVQE